ncbi:hypothetical protein M513_04452, partial [Trichuris suis]
MTYTLGPTRAYRDRFVPISDRVVPAGGHLAVVRCPIQPHHLPRSRQRFLTAYGWSAEVHIWPGSCTIQAHSPLMPHHNRYRHASGESGLSASASVCLPELLLMTPWALLAGSGRGSGGSWGPLACCRGSQSSSISQKRHDGEYLSHGAGHRRPRQPDWILCP